MCPPCHELDIVIQIEKRRNSFQPPKKKLVSPSLPHKYGLYVSSDNTAYLINLPAMLRIPKDAGRAWNRHELSILCVQKCKMAHLANK